MKKGDKVTFVKYEELQDGQDPIFNEGDELVISKKIDDETFECHLEDDETVRDQVFDTEIKADKKAAKKTAVKKTAAKKAPAKKAPAKKVAVKKAAKKAVKKTAAKKAPAKQAPAEKEEQEEAPRAKSKYSAGVQKLIKTDHSALKAAKSLADRIQQTFWDLGGVLSYIRNRKSYMKMEDGKGNCVYAGNEGFAQYVEAELGIKYRKAMYYIDIYESFTDAGVKKPEPILALGWAKAKELTKVITKENHKDWLKKAGEMSRDDLQATIRDTKVKASSGEGTTNPPDETAKMSTFSFRVFEDQGGICKEALDKAMEEIDVEDNKNALNAAFVHICTEWMSLQS